MIITVSARTLKFMDMKYTGNYFGSKFVKSVYEPTVKATEHLQQKFKHKYKVGDNVVCRKRHRKTTTGIIEDAVYTSEGSFGGKVGGGTVKAYKINGIYFYEGEIKRLAP